MVLLLVSAGMVSVPGRADSVAEVRDFYSRHVALIVIAQLVGLVAAVVLIVFARRLGQDGAHSSVTTTGVAVGAAAVVTAAPVLWLCAVADSASARNVDRLATASDLVDVLLFAAIALFGAMLARWVVPTWLRVVSLLVALTAGVRAVALLGGSGFLEVVAPMAFVVFVALLSSLLLARRPLFP